VAQFGVVTAAFSFLGSQQPTPIINYRLPNHVSPVSSILPLSPRLCFFSCFGHCDNRLVDLEPANPPYTLGSPSLIPASPLQSSKLRQSCIARTCLILSSSCRIVEIRFSIVCHDNTHSSSQSQTCKPTCPIHCSIYSPLCYAPNAFMFHDNLSVPSRPRPSHRIAPQAAAGASVAAGCVCRCQLFPVYRVPRTCTAHHISHTA